MDQMKSQVETIIGSYRPRQVKRYLVTALGGYFPVADQTPSGEILAVVRGGDYHMGQRGWLDLVGSADGGESWSRPERIAGEGLDNRNAAFGVLRDGTILFAYAEAASYADGQWLKDMGRWRYWYTRSTDGGKTWQPRQTLRSSKAWKITSPFGKIIELPDGTAILPVYGANTETHDPTNYKAADDRALILFSSDRGQTWGEPHPISDSILNETALCYTRSGDIVALARRDDEPPNWHGHHLFVLRSADSGRTWSEPVQVTAPNEAPADVIQLKSGTLLAVFGRRRFPMGVGVLVSRDGGRTWSTDREVMLVGDSKSGDCGYPSSVQRRDGRIVTLYYSVECLGVPAWGNHCGAVIYDEADVAE